MYPCIRIINVNYIREGADSERRKHKSWLARNEVRRLFVKL